MKLIDFLNKLNTKCYPDNNIRRWNYRVGRLLLRILADPLLSIILKCSKYSYNTSNYRDVDVIVSLTSFPARINNVWKTIATLKRQSMRPKFIILWLSSEEFPNELDDVPNNLRSQIDELFKIKFVKGNLKSHKKYYYAFKAYSEYPVVTVDDDVFYDSKMLERLYSASENFPDCVICNRGLLISPHKSYSLWYPLRNEYGPSSNICPTGVGGVLYPPHSCKEEIFNEAAIKSTCINADDLWLNFMSRMNGTKIVKTEGFIEPIVVNSSQKEALCKTNNGIENKNDIQINQISNYAKKNFGCDYFIGI